jgi:signal transduction histidine kinase
MKWINNISIKGKIVFVILSVTYSSILLWSIVAMLQYARETRRSFDQSMQMSIRIIADYAVAPITFGDTVEVYNVLSRTSAINAVTGIAVYGNNNEQVSNFVSENHKQNIVFPYQYNEAINNINAEYKIFVSEVFYKDITYGIIIMYAETKGITEKIRNYGINLAIILVILALFAYLAALYMQRLISKPIQTLAAVSRKVSETNDYSVRVSRQTQDEITELYNAFNGLLSQLQYRDQIRTEYEKQINAAKIKAEEADKLKTAFLTNMSHELRTPMNAILGFSTLLLEEEIPAKQRENFVDIINESGNTLLSLVDDILDISKIEAGQISIKHEPTNLTRILDELFLSFNEIKQQKKINNVTLVLDSFGSTTELTILTDSFRLRQVLMNLIGNALKFTDSGNITFGIENVGYDEIVFFVSDTGIGISPDQIPYIFDRFRKIDNEKNRLFRGAGLGLAISQKLVELLGGRIWVESEMGKGTIFRFTIPSKQTNESEKRVIRKRMHLDTQKRLRILVAEDDANNYQFIFQILNRYNVEISWARDGQEALDYCNKELFDVILMDIKMPVMDGFIATEKIKSRFPNVRIIAQTAYAGQTEIEKCLNAGCDDFITKPINPNLLVSKLFSS